MAVGPVGRAGNHGSEGTLGRRIPPAPRVRGGSGPAGVPICMVSHSFAGAGRQVGDCAGDGRFGMGDVGGRRRLVGLADGCRRTARRLPHALGCLSCDVGSFAAGAALATGRFRHCHVICSRWHIRLVRGNRSWDAPQFWSWLSVRAAPRPSDCAASSRSGRLGAAYHSAGRRGGNKSSIATLQALTVC